jgi:poly(3-hydroxybutyrate) depolymerase
MWYTIYDTQVKALRQTNAYLQKFATPSWVMPLIGPNLYARAIDAAFQGTDRLFKEYAKPTFGITEVTSAAGLVSKVTESVVCEKPFCKLVAFTKEGRPSTAQREIFIVAPLSGHYATLLRDMVDRLLLDADTVWITDWTNAREVPLDKGTFTLADYVTYVQDFCRLIGRRVHTIAVCQPAVPALAAAALMSESADPCRPLSLTLIGGPVDARKSPTSVDNYAVQHPTEWFRKKVIDRVPLGYAGAGRLVYPGFLQYFGFLAMNPKKHSDAYQDFVKDVARGDIAGAAKHTAFYDEYNAVLDMDATYYLETIEEVFHKFSLAEGTLSIHGHLVRPSCIVDIPLLTIEGELDDIAGVGQTKAAHSLCRTLPDKWKKHIEMQGVGHYGLFAGTRFRTIGAPAMVAWMDEAVLLRASRDGGK